MSCLPLREWGGVGEMSVDWYGPDSGDEREELPAAQLATRQTSGHAGMFAWGSIGEVVNDPTKAHHTPFH